MVADWERRGLMVDMAHRRRCMGAGGHTETTILCALNLRYVGRLQVRRIDRRRIIDL